MTKTYDFISALASLTGKPPEDFTGFSALALIAQDDAGTLSITHWDTSLGAMPTIEALIAQATVTTVAQLRAYAIDKVSRLLAHTRAYHVDGLTLMSDCTDGSIARLNALLMWGSFNDAITANWVDNDYNVTALTGAQFVALAQAVGAYGQSLFSAELTAVLASIADGTITTTDQIDAYAWTE
jgi:hypothetical protein